MKVVRDGIKERSMRKVVAALRQFSEVVGTNINLVDKKDAAVQEGPAELTLRVGERWVRRPSWTQPALIEIGGPPVGRFGLERAVPDVVYWSGTGGLGVHVQHLAGGGKESTSLLWTLSEKKGAGGSYFDEKPEGPGHERKARAARTCGKYGRRRWPMLCGFAERLEGGADGCSTCCTLEDQAGGQPYMQKFVPVW